MYSSNEKQNKTKKRLYICSHPSWIINLSYIELSQGCIARFVLLMNIFDNVHVNVSISLSP